MHRISEVIPRVGRDSRVTLQSVSYSGYRNGARASLWLD